MKQVQIFKKSLVMSALAMMLGLFALPQAQATTLWASDSLSGPGGSVAPGLYELDATNGTVLNTITGFSPAGTYADAMSFTPDGNSIFVLDSSTNADVRQIDLAGNVLNSFFVPLDAEGLTILANGTLIIGGGGSNTIATVDSTNGTILSQFTPTAAVYGLASNGIDTLFGLRINGIIDVYDLAGSLLNSISTGIGGATLGLAYTGSSFYVAATGSTITEVSLDGSTIIRSFAGPAAFTEGLDFPHGVQVTVPEPATIALMGLGLAGLGFTRRRKA